MNSYFQTGPSQYRGRGGRPFRGAGRGRGRGLNGGRNLPSRSYGPAISNAAYAPAAAAAAAGATSEVQPSSSVSGQTAPKPAQVPAAPLKPSPRYVQCEICKVDCNTPEILEQHKKGKRHMKNIKVHEELQRHKAINGQQSVLIPSTQLNLTDQLKQVQESDKKGYPTENMVSEVTAINGQQSGQIPSSQLSLTDQPKQVRESETRGCSAENMGSEVAADNHKAEKELQNDVGQTSEVPAEEPAGKTTYNSAVRGRGLKRKMKGGRGCKYTRTDDGSRRPVAPPKPQQAAPFICELCNVKCETQVVYDSHLTGKKHLSRLKRVKGRQASSRVVGLQAHYPSDINALANAINAQVQQGDSDPQVLLAQLLMTLLSQAQLPAIASSSSPVAAQLPAPTSVAGSSYEPQLSQTQVSEITAQVQLENSTGETKNQMLPVLLQLDNLPGLINTLANTITAQIKQGVSDPQVLFAQLLMTLLSQAQVPGIAPSVPAASQIPVSTSVAESSFEPQLLQTQLSEITAHAELGNPTGETKNQLSSVPLELDALAGSSSGTLIAGESSKTKQQVLKHPQDSSGITPADNSGVANDQIPSKCEAPSS